MNHDYLEVRIGNSAISVPICSDPAATQTIAKEITQRLQEIEKSSPRIDTQAFALRAAYDFAAEAYELRQRLDAADREFLRALDELNTRLNNILKEHEARCAGRAEDDR